MKRLILCLLLLLSFPSLSHSSEMEAEPYVIGRDDVLEISVWQSPDLTKTVAVRFDGSIDYSFLGKVPAAGRTTAELQSYIREMLAKGYVKDPKVDVTVKEYNSKKILVFGEVGKPGLYKLKGNVPLLELLFMVEGVKGAAKRLTVIRSGELSSSPIPEALKPRGQDGRSEGGILSDEADEGGDHSAIDVDLIALLSKGDLSQNIMIMPGDTIYVSAGTGMRYYVLGQVKNPGPYEWVPDVTVLDAIKLANGPTDLAALNRIKVRMKKGGRDEEIKVNVVDIMKGKRKDDVKIEPDSVIIVPKSWI